MLNPGDHSFIKHESYVAYKLCRIERAKVFEERVASGEYVDMGQVSADFLDRVLEGLNNSSHVKPFVKTFLEG